MSFMGYNLEFRHCVEDDMYMREVSAVKDRLEKLEKVCDQFKKYW